MFRLTAKPGRPASPRKRYAGRLSLLPALMSLLLGACLAPTPSREQALALRDEAESLFDRSQIPAAREKMCEAFAAAPRDVEIAMRLGDLYEYTDLPDKAAAIYHQTLKSSALSPPQREELLYRSALLALFSRQRPEEARQITASLPEGPRRGDLQAALTLTAGSPRKALEELNAVRAVPLEPTVAARVALHAARAYAALGLYDEAFAQLYLAINHSGRSATARDVELFWTDLKARTGRQ